MNLDDALDWLDRKKVALAVEADATLAARHERFLVDTQQALDDTWRSVAGDTWTTLNAGYPGRLASLMNGLSAAVAMYAADVAGLVRSYGARARHFGYFGQAWMLAAQLPGTVVALPGRSPDDIVKAVGGAIEGVDLAAAIENMRIEFLQRARREMILSQAAGEKYHKARARLLDTAGLTEERTLKESLQ